MPGPFKIGTLTADAVTVSDTVVNETTDAFLLDGDAPRLGTNSAPMLPNVPHPSSFSNVDSGPTLPVVSQVLSDGSSPTLPTLPMAAPTATPTTTPTTTAAVESTTYTATGEPRHPMAHLMPEKSKPSEASQRAAEARAVKKKKAKKIKIIVGACALVVTAVLGPPLVKWTVNAVNEAGSVSKDEPAETPAGVQAIDDAKQLTSSTTPPVAP